MLYPINQDEFDLKKLINSKCGKEYSIVKRIIKNNFGSCRYKIVGISPPIQEINIDNYNDNIHLNFDLRDNGIVFYFRFKNTEYVEFCSYHLSY